MASQDQCTEAEIEGMSSRVQSSYRALNVEPLFVSMCSYGAMNIVPISIAIY